MSIDKINYSHEDYEKYRYGDILDNIINYINSLGYDYKKEDCVGYILYNESYSQIANLLSQKSLDELNGHFALMIGWFLEFTEYKYSGKEIIFKYYKHAANEGTIYGLIRIGNYYENYAYMISNENKMLKYYKLASELGDSNGFYHIGKYYGDKGKIDESLKYLMMAVDKNNKYAMHELAIHYNMKLDFINMEKYLIMAIENNNSNALLHLMKLNDNGEKYDECIQLAITYNNVDYKYCKEYINKIIFNCKEFKSYIDAYDYLDDENVSRLNKLLSNIMLFKKNDNKIFTSFECVNCLIFKDCLYYPCGHPYCYECCSNDIKCRICNSN